MKYETWNMKYKTWNMKYETYMKHEKRKLKIIINIWINLFICYNQILYNFIIILLFINEFIQLYNLII
jgi:hypothetical protein